MKLKLDENLGRTPLEMFREAGHDVKTVREQDLAGTTDRDLIEAGRDEQRGLVRLDLDFANPLTFRPAAFGGIAVPRLPPRPAPSDLHEEVRTLIGGLMRDSLEGRLWVVQRERIRQHQSDDEAAR